MTMHIHILTQSTTMQTPAPLFPLGEVRITHLALEALHAAGQGPMEYLHRHQSGDWAEMDKESADDNRRAVESGESRVLSVFMIEGMPEKLWIITEWDRSVTTVLLPSEY